MNVVQIGVHQLSTSSTQLLIAVLTKGDLLAVHKQGFELQPDMYHLSNAPRPTAPFPAERILRLWRLVFCAMENPPTTVARLLSHLADTLGIDKHSELEHADLLADLIDHCGKLSKEGKLPAAELTSHALKVHSWSQSATGVPVGFAEFVSLRALYYATTHIPESVLVKAPDSGLSPVTPFLELLRLLHEGLSAPGTLAAAKSQPIWSTRITHTAALLSTYAKRHNSFLCTRSRAFYPREGITANPRSSVFSADSNRLFIGSDEADAWVVDLTTETCESLTPSTLPSGTAFHLATFSSDGRWTVWGSRNGRVLVVDAAETPPKQRSLDSLIRGNNAHPMAVSWDNKHVVFGSEDSWADVVDLDASEVIMSFEEHTNRPCRGAFAPSPYHLVATSSFDNTVKIWDVFDGTCMQSFDALTLSVNAVAWSPDGSLIAISSFKTILVYAWRKLELRATLEGHTKLITGLSFSPNGKLVASSANDHSVRVWSVEKASCIATLTGPNDDFNSVAFSPNGRYLAGAADNSVWVWDINPDCVHAAV